MEVCNIPSVPHLHFLTIALRYGDCSFETWEYVINPMNNANYYNVSTLEYTGPGLSVLGGRWVLYNSLTHNLYLSSAPLPSSLSHLYGVSLASLVSLTHVFHVSLGSLSCSPPSLSHLVSLVSCISHGCIMSSYLAFFFLPIAPMTCCNLV